MEKATCYRGFFYGYNLCKEIKSVDHTEQPVPMLDLSRQYRSLQKELDRSVTAVNESGQFVLGPEVRRLEEQMATYCKTAYGVGCASGSDALLLALMARGVGPGDEVIVPSFTFFATAGCVPRLGATPVFVDIDPVTFNLDPVDVEAKISSRTKAIIPVHLFGQMADMPALIALTKESNAPQRKEIMLIEDAAQAIGAELNSVRTGNWGEITCLSFYPTKNLGGAGDGGMIVTNDPNLEKEIRLLRGHGMEPRYYHKVVGINSRLDSYQAAVLNVKLPHLDDWTQKRQTNAANYHRLFNEAGLAETVGIPQELPNMRHVWNQYVVRIPQGRRDSLRTYLTERKIGTDIYYPMGLHQQECFRCLGYAPEDLPETFRAGNEVLALPLYPELRPDEQVTVVNAIRSFYRG